jgi:hypothetical protein
MISFKPLSRVERAAEIARNALHGRVPVLPTEWSLWAGRVYHSTLYRNFYILAMLALCVLAWWEPLFKRKPGGEPAPPDDPPAGVAAAARSLLALALGDDDDDKEPSGAVLSAAGLAAVRAVDGVLIALAAFDLWLQERYHGLRGARRGWIIAKAVVTLALLSNWIAVLVKPSAPYWTRALRPILLLERMRNVRKIAGNIMRSVPAILNVGALLVLTHVFFSVLGVVLFAGISDQSCARVRGQAMPNPLGCTAFWEDDDNPDNPFACRAYFNSLDEASMQLFAFLAGAANFPNVMIVRERARRKGRPIPTFHRLS